jgi:hypothetical protein
MPRLALLLIVFALLTGCATEESALKPNDNHEPVPGEATPPPEVGPRGGWAW